MEEGDTSQEKQAPGEAGTGQERGPPGASERSAALHMADVSPVSLALDS